MSCTPIQCLTLMVLAAGYVAAIEHRGVTRFGTLPVPGETVKAQQGDRTLTALADADGAYRFADVADGTLAVKVEMRGFVPSQREVQVMVLSTAPVVHGVAVAASPALEVEFITVAGSGEQ